MIDRPDPLLMLRRLYRDEHGYQSDTSGEASIIASGSSSVYGELMPTATNHLIDHLKLGSKDVFYDLGSGVGKVVLQVAMTVALRRCIGIELMPSRHRLARRMLKQARQSDLLRTQDCQVRHSDFMRARISDASVVYTCSTAFSTEFMNTLADRLARLPVGLRWVSTQDLDANANFCLEDVVRLDMSWRRRSKVHIYRLVRSRG